MRSSAACTFRRNAALHVMLVCQLSQRATDRYLPGFVSKQIVAYPSKRQTVQGMVGSSRWIHRPRGYAGGYGQARAFGGNGIAYIHRASFWDIPWYLSVKNRSLYGPLHRISCAEYCRKIGSS